MQGQSRVSFSKKQSNVKVLEHSGAGNRLTNERFPAPRLAASTPTLGHQAGMVPSFLVALKPSKYKWTTEFYLQYI
jgi:hypothetical protein